MTEKRKLEDNELEQVSGGTGLAETNRHISEADPPAGSGLSDAQPAGEWDLGDDMVSQRHDNNG